MEIIAGLQVVVLIMIRIMIVMIGEVPDGARQDVHGLMMSIIQGVTILFSGITEDLSV